MDLVDDEELEGHDRAGTTPSHSTTNGHGNGNANGPGAGGGAVIEVEVEVDEEEEAMNSAPKPPKIKEYEPEAERHRPHDPLVSVLQSYTNVSLLSTVLRPPPTISGPPDLRINVSISTW